MGLFLSSRVATTLMEYKVESGCVNRQFRIVLSISVEVQIDVDPMASLQHQLPRVHFILLQRVFQIAERASLPAPFKLC